MQLIDGRPVYSATDLVGYLSCAQLTNLERAALAGLVAAPQRPDAELDVLHRRGLEHEQRYLEQLRAQGKLVVEIEPDGSVADHGEQLRRAAQATEAAMAQGVDAIYQATFFNGRWRGHADFLLRVDDPDRPSCFGPHHYEVADTKLARHVKASALLQICCYVDQLERVQGVRPERMHVVLGGSTQRTETFRVNDFMAYYRAARDRFEAAVSPGVPPAVFPLPAAPDPVEHCEVCRWSEICEAQRRREDHLSLVAGISGHQRRALVQRGIATLASLGRLPLPLDPPLQGASRPALERLRDQARIQLDGRESDKMLFELLLPIEPNRGLASVPAPSPGDLFLDLEGDPYAFEDGLDYLFGVLEPSRTNDDAQPAFHAFWSMDAGGEFSMEAEKKAFESAVDLIIERLAADPGLHVYHYASYEPTALKRLMGRYGTREEEVDRLLRGGVLVDLYRAVRQGVRASVESYSIKRLEPLYGFERSISLRDATSSIVEFEAWLELGAGERPGAQNLERILLYNRDDVLSAWRLRDWLEGRRAALVEQGIDVPRPQPREGVPSERLSDRLQRVAAVASRLTKDVPADPDERTSEQQACWLLAQLLSWHRREEKSTWWLYYHLMNELTDDERIEANEPLGGLEFTGVVGESRQSRTYRYRFPTQEHDVDVGTAVFDPATGRSAGTVVELDDSERTVDLRRGKRGGEVPHPTSLVPLDHVDTAVLQNSLLELGEWVVENGIDADGARRAARDLLLRAWPRLGAGAPPPLPDAPLRASGEDALDAARRLALALDQSVLPIQGPPGSGKTYAGARMICALLAAGRKVGITATSHKVIANLLWEVCRAAGEETGVQVRAIQKAEVHEVCAQPQVTRAATNKAVRDALVSGEANLAAGTAWLWARPEMAETVDVLFVDEAGQLSLANALTVAAAARSIVLLGDPQQLDQPLQGVHPPGADTSALGHVLGANQTMPPDQGLFLETTWRLHPDLCGFTSEAFYESRLNPQAQLALQRVWAPKVPLADGTGPRIDLVSHVGNDTESIEEAEQVARLVRELVEEQASWVDRFGREQPIHWEDVVVVAPYNAQVGAIQRLLPAAARVGTVDKFQGQEAPISIYSMATSSAEDAPRGMGFLYNRHRLNVATSRARCVAVVVCSPDLLRARARTPEQMRQANALCQFVEAVEPVAE